MNILQLAKYYPPVFGGIELVEKMMTKAFQENGDNVFICAFDKNNSSESGEYKESIFRFKETFNFMGAPVNFNLFFSFKKIILENKIKKIYVHLPNPFMHELVSIYHTFLEKEKVQVIGVYHSDVINKKWIGDLYSLYFKWRSNVYHKFIASSENLWNSSKVLSQIANAKKLIIPFCIEENFTILEKENFSNRLVSIGRMVPYKGYEFLIQTLNNTNYELHLVGGGPLFHKLKKMAGKNIIFHSNISEMEKDKLFNESDLLIVSSISNAEAYGMTIVESLGRGIPVVATKLPTGVTYLVQDNLTGLTFENQNSQALINCIDRFKTNPELYRAVSKNAKKFYSENLTFKIFKEKLVNS